MKNVTKKIAFWTAVALVPGGTLLLLYKIINNELKEHNNGEYKPRGENDVSTQRPKERNVSDPLAESRSFRGDSDEYLQESGSDGCEIQ